MSSSKARKFKRFDQDNYNNTFYCCDKEHEFIAFVSIYCPLCGVLNTNSDLITNLQEANKELEEVEDNYYNLVGKVNKTSPELLV